MTLNDALVQRFAKAVGNGNAKTSAPAESYLYGTVNSITKSGDDITYDVLFDGAQMTTPVVMSGVVAKKSDRVLVMMKNRTPQIVSNLTTKTINADYLESEGAVFKWKHPNWPAYETKVSIGENAFFPIRVTDNSDTRVVGIYHNAINLSGPTYGNDTYYSVDISSEGMTVFDHLADDDCWYGPRGQSPSSDRRLKEQITPLDWQIGANLIPVSFVFSKNPRVKHFGFIAQDVQEVHPDAVIEESNGRLRLIYHELIAPTLALAQHNHDEIEVLKRRIEELERRLANVEAQNNSVSTEE